jgi:AcrR family transcriptional regulator
VSDADEPTSDSRADTPDGETTTGRGSLDRRRIIDAAVVLIDEFGLRQLTMRRLGAHLGVEGMALYHYIPGRESLLDGIAETVIDDLHDDPELMLVGRDWRGFLRRLALAVRRTALAHPEVFPLIATRPSTTALTRPPLRSLQWTETYLQAMRDCGLGEQAALASYRGFCSFLLGQLLVELAGRPAGRPAAGSDPAPWDLAPDGSKYPMLAAIEPQSLLASSADFDQQLEWLLHRLAAAFID